MFNRLVQCWIHLAQVDILLLEEDGAKANAQVQASAKSKLAHCIIYHKRMIDCALDHMKDLRNNMNGQACSTTFLEVSKSMYSSKTVWSFSFKTPADRGYMPQTAATTFSNTSST